MLSLFTILSFYSQAQTIPSPSHTMSTDADKTAPESQFQKPGDLVENDDDLGLTEIESLCMNCHENVSPLCCAR